MDDSESIVDYYRSIIENAERIAMEHGEQKETVESLANVFIKCYKIYNEKVLISQWEAKLGYRAKEDFYVMFVDSIENGPEAILIADNKDIFTIPDSECFDMKINFFPMN